MDRRTFLAAGAGLAGCVSDPADPAGPKGDDDGAGDGKVGGGDGVASTGITTTDTDCAGPDDDRVVADVDDAGSTVTLEGVLGAPTPCHEAAITAASVGDGHLSVTVDVVEDPAEDETCARCQGAISYGATVELDDGVTVEGGSVDHATGGTHEFAAVGGAAPSVGRTAIETTDAACAGGAGGEVSVERADGLVAIEGTFTAPNPCHEAVIEGVTVEGDTLQVDVDRQSTLGEGEFCQECVGAISYEATVEVAPLDALADVRVGHPDGSGVSTDGTDGPDGSACGT